MIWQHFDWLILVMIIMSGIDARAPNICAEHMETISHIAKFMGPTWGPPGSCRSQMGRMLVPWTLLSGIDLVMILGVDTMTSSRCSGINNRHVPLPWLYIINKALTQPKNSRYLLHYYGSTLIPAWISKYIGCKIWNWITYPLSNFSGAVW